MTTWWICPWDNQAVIDDASIHGIDCSGIPDNIYLIWWYGEWGEILYKHQDRLPIREPFTDFGPYVGIYNEWIRLAQRRTPAITLAQAKFVKSRMVDALRVHRDKATRAIVLKNAIGEMTTVESIADYDILQGWED